MKAPDKIYIQPDIEEDDFRVWLLSPFNDKSVCYIRKDALLEWAKEWHERYPYSHEFEMIIDKINSL